MDTLKSKSDYPIGKIVDLLVRLGVLFLIIGWCINILRPFVLILIWAAVIAIAIFPLHRFLAEKLRLKRILAAILLTLVMLSILILPALMVMKSLGYEMNNLKEQYQAGQSIIPMPGPSTENW